MTTQTITGHKYLDALGISHDRKLVRLDRSWGEWVSMPQEYDSEEVTQEDVQHDNMVEVIPSARVDAMLEQFAAEDIAESLKKVASSYQLARVVEGYEDLRQHEGLVRYRLGADYMPSAWSKALEILAEAE